jgi:acetyl esterase
MTAKAFDPDLFRLEAVTPETTSFNNELQLRLSATKPLHTLSPQTARGLRASGQSIWGPIRKLDHFEERTLPGPSGDVPVRIYIPEKVRGVYLYLHGGGFIMGSAHERDIQNSEIADTSDVAVVSVDYRLAPENPYPAAPDDCETAALWLAKQARAEFGTETLLIGGESVGGTLAVVTLLRMRDRHNFAGFCGAQLSYGVYDLECTPSLLLAENESLIISKATMQWFNEHYVSKDRYREPDVSPLYADLRQMPPALFTIGTMDPLIDDTLFMYSRWVAAGNEGELAIYPGGVHAFDLFPIPIANQAKARIQAFISECTKND